MSDSDTLFEIDNKILAYNELIEYQKNEIIKTASIISDFKNCLSRQNEALSVFVSEREQLRTQKNTEINSTLINSVPIETIKFDSKPPVKNPCIESGEESELRNGESDNTNNRKRKLINGDDDCTKKKMTCLLNPSSKIDVKQIQIAEVKDKRIETIFVYGTDIYIGGSNGMLLRHTSDYTHVYETNTSDDIRQIAVLKDIDKLSINVFTKDKLIIYEDVKWYKQRNEIDVPGIGDIFLDDSFIYIPFNNGLLRRLGNNVLKESPGLAKKVSCFIPCYGNSKLALISFEDHRLYTTSKSDPVSFRPVIGLRNVVGVRRLMNQYFVCYSIKKLWLLNSAFTIIHDLVFEEEISLVAVCEGCIVVIDGTNKVHWHSLVNNRRLEPRILYRDKVNGPVSAVCFVNNKVYLAVGNEIVIIAHRS